MLINTGLREDLIFLSADGILTGDEGMLLIEEGIPLLADGIFKRRSFFLSIRAAEENVAGKTKLMEINSKHFAIRGALFFRLILHYGSGGEDKPKAQSICLKPKA